MGTLFSFFRGILLVVGQGPISDYWGEIYGITEFHISTIRKPPCSCEPLHYVLLYGEKFIDIRGIWSEKDLLDDWRNMMIEISSRNKIFDYKLTLSDISNLPNYHVEG